MAIQPDLGTSYLGLKLQNPIIVGSCRLTDSADGVKKCAEAGAGAVVLKSLFEEQINAEMADAVSSSQAADAYGYAAEYISGYGAESAVGDYLRLVEAAKKAVRIPVIPSVNCVSSKGWTSFARRIQNAGADALELNVWVNPAAANRSAEDNEKVYLDVLAAVKAEVSIPVALKVGPFWSSMAASLTRLGIRGADGLVLFNHFYQPDLNIEEFKVVAGPALSTAEDMGLPLRTIAQLSGNMPCDLCASSGITDGESVVKMLLVGAAAVQIVSAFYRGGVEQIGGMLAEVGGWMSRHQFETIDRFRGKMRQEGWPEGAAYDRVQFMRRTLEGRAL
ncbi:MAG: dihydroorotate dehydrogenase-like protein [Candidatus Krumholzibacteriia bacterium]